MLVGAACTRGLDDDSTPADQEVASRAQTPAGTSADRTDAAGDVRQFVEQAAIANMAEIQLGNLAQQRAQNNDVKQFARMMVTDHTKALAELRTAAQSVSLTLPSDLDDKHHDLHQRLSSLQGADFDREYMKAMVDGHEDVADLLDNRAEGHDSSVAPGTTAASATAGTAQNAASIDAWAAKTLPAVKSHLERAKAIDAKLK